MSIQMLCSSCQTNLHLPDQMAGKRLKCAQCGQIQVVSGAPNSCATNSTSTGLDIRAVTSHLPKAIPQPLSSCAPSVRQLGSSEIIFKTMYLCDLMTQMVVGGAFELVSVPIVWLFLIFSGEAVLHGYIIGIGVVLQSIVFILLRPKIGFAYLGISNIVLAVGYGILTVAAFRAKAFLAVPFTASLCLVSLTLALYELFAHRRMLRALNEVNMNWRQVRRIHRSWIVYMVSAQLGTKTERFRGTLTSASTAEKCGVLCLMTNTGLVISNRSLLRVLFEPGSQGVWLAPRVMRNYGASTPGLLNVDLSVRCTDGDYCLTVRKKDLKKLESWLQVHGAQSSSRAARAYDRFRASCQVVGSTIP